MRTTEPANAGRFEGQPKHMFRATPGFLLCLLVGCQAEPGGETPPSGNAGKADEAVARPDAQGDPVGEAVSSLLDSAAKQDPAELDPMVDALAALGPPAIRHLAARLQDAN